MKYNISLYKYTGETQHILTPPQNAHNSQRQHGAGTEQRLTEVRQR